MPSEPTVEQQITDRQTQTAKLLAFLQDHPLTLFTQETLAESCGAHIGAIRTRLSELKRAGEPLVAETQYYSDETGRLRVAPKLWMYVPRPAEPLGRDASSEVLGQRTLFDGHDYAIGPRVTLTAKETDADVVVITSKRWRQAERGTPHV